jgi:hypothetical protein
MTFPAPKPSNDPSPALLKVVQSLIASKHLHLKEITLVKSRAWSTVWRIETETIGLYLKVAGPGFEREIQLLPHLSALFPDMLPRVVGYNEASGWLLLEDAGTSLRDLLSKDRALGLQSLGEALDSYAHLQIAASTKQEISRLAENGQVTSLASRLETLLADSAVLGEGGATESEFHSFEASLPRCVALSKALATSGLPDTVDHGDLHANNIMLQKGRPRFIDWGDAIYGHPFPSLAITIDATRETLDGELPEVNRLTAAYLGPWREAFPLCDHDAALTTAIALRPVYGALLWYRGVTRMSDTDRRTAAGWIVHLLRRFVVEV